MWRAPVVKRLQGKRIRHSAECDLSTLFDLSARFELAVPAGAAGVVMQKQVIEIGGEAVGVVVPDEDRLKFVAVKSSVWDLDSQHI